MKGNQSEGCSYRRETLRVRAFVDQASLETLNQLKRLSPQQLKELIASHRFLLIKSLSALKLFSSPVPSGAKTQKKMTPSHMLSQRRGGGGPKPHAEERSEGPFNWMPKKVRGWQFKEVLLAQVYLQRALESPSLTKRHQVAPFSEEGSETLLQTQEWQDALSQHEERHFQITRITKILST